MSQQALLVLDLQNEMVSPEGKVGGGGLAAVVQERGVLANAAKAIAHCRSKGIPVVFVRVGYRADYKDVLSVAPRLEKLKSHNACVAGTWGTEFPASIAPREDELVITKQCVNPFNNTILMSWLHARGIKQLLIGGVVTNLVVESTARAADDAGFAVTVLEDLCAAPNAQWHEFAVKNTLPLFGSVTTSDAFFK